MSTLFDYERERRADEKTAAGIRAGGERRDNAMVAVDKAHAAALKASWQDAIATVASRQTLFTTDDVIEYGLGIGLEEPRENRVFGPWMTAAASKGLCARTAAFSPSNRPALHATPIRVWLSTAHGATVGTCSDCSGLGIVIIGD